MSSAFRESKTHTFRESVNFVTGFGVVADQPWVVGSPSTTNSNLITYNNLIPYGDISGYSKSSQVVLTTGQQQISGFKSFVEGIGSFGISTTNWINYDLVNQQYDSYWGDIGEGKVYIDMGGTLFASTPTIKGFSIEPTSIYCYNIDDGIYNLVWHNYVGGPFYLKSSNEFGANAYLDLNGSLMINSDYTPALSGFRIFGNNDTQITAASPVITDSSTSRTLLKSDSSKYIKFTNSSPINVTIPPQSSVAWNDDTEITFEQGGLGQITMVSGAGVTINSSTSLKSFGRYAVVKIKRTALNTWTFFGDKV